MYDVAIIGCGIVGASVAYELSRYNLRIIIIEKENDVATGATKANSAILHAGYDPEPGTLMAKLNVQGVRLAKEACAALDVPYKQCGSLVIAFDNEDKKTLRKLYVQSIKNNVGDCQIISGNKARELEPNLSPDVCSALYAPSAAIVNPWELCLALAETAVVNGVELALENLVTDITRTVGGFTVITDKSEFDTKYVINAAGVHSDEIHRMLSSPSFDIIPTRGEYYLLDKSEGNRVNRIIFQCPSKAGKGVLVAPTVHGNLLVGPNSQVIDECENTATTSYALDYIAETAKKSVPSIIFKDSIRNFAGVRANSTKKDFIIEEPVHGFIDLAGIKSPGLSAAMAIGKMVSDMLNNKSLPLTEKTDFINKRKKIRINTMNKTEISEAIKTNPAYGKIICRCETVSEGEILDAFSSPIPPRSIDGIKRRCNAGMGRCQGGFCSPRVSEILSQKLNIDLSKVLMDKAGSYILTDKTKGAGDIV